ncbi:MAG: gliding motility-associated ABC transporter ATP-binding subunit GldA [Lentimicrobium sp.]|jgi:ABC-2 type transport system ATP-binding protein|uniref:gliding motility-associated ABC transporter ATP-binding subunit GldA n=1 Tax=Lentimicrobium sp. TaxID=2034841 RepID=UPI0025F59443|nr:gliding motility-associated ABC transporter ATP-binding subunit GldA [Lentimicrobium sp.]MCO5256842.1 gliding motility-associated ABC transporter ATP-binding subunit GldA [Lentimicrobium sp.]HPF65097.1 gliding motility-associated ABC transporter ATP-binding subunit GldA [Lentimicrobium sp.]HRW69230.1 gliding motility-associated ABC transporter ATP-binding subunit GldA [Lentimicrobium sp.]
MSIKVSNISKQYGQQKALDQVSFSIKPGEIVGLLGPNGAGKSTMMKIITCFIPPTAGDVSVCGFDIREQSLEVRQKVGYLPENNPLYTDMYIREYLEFVAGVHRLGKNTAKRVDEMMEVTGLMPERKKKIGTLSKGYRQRVGLAQAMIHNPEVLILDEPTSGLDPNQLVEIRNLIIEIGKEKTVMLSTHIMQEVEAMCSRAIIINSGKIVADDSTGHLLNSNENTEQIAVEFDKDVKPSMLKGLPGVVNVKKISGNSWVIEAGKDHDVRQDIFRFAVENSFTVLSMQKQGNRLEDVFQQLTKK